jgi:hypothetical protein
MTLHGTVCDGRIVLPSDVVLPEGCTVAVTVVLPVDAAEQRDSGLPLVNGIPVFAAVEGNVRPDLELVNRLRDELP